MPTCPGCEQQVPYERLDIHERYCAAIWSEDRLGGASLERLDRQIAEIEQTLDRRLRKIEADVEKHVNGSSNRKRRTTE